MTSPSVTAQKAVAIGVSAGAFDALSVILPGLPADYPLPVFVVVHLPPDKDSMLHSLLQDKCAVKVREAEDKEKIVPGTVYIAPPDYHMQVEQDKTLSLSSDEPVLFSRPSADVLFETAADSYRAGLIGVILTGASGDGANGLKTIMDKGGGGIVQNPDTAVATAMPLAAIELCPDARVMTLGQIARYLQDAPHA
jgi:two-component system chemotaxis response regulator CheB